MKNILFSVFLIAITHCSLAQTINPDIIIGNWISPEKDLIVQCCKQNNKYFAKILWFKVYNDNAPINPDGAPESTWLNTIVMKDFVFDTDEWNDGYITDIKSGKTYTAYIEQSAPNTLKVTGYVFFRFLSETITFSKYTNSKMPCVNNFYK